jgi:dTDP-4-dehydrorhamnose 3,5-epimerase
VRCTQGSVLDVCVDLRPDSPTYLAHAAVELSAENLRALYVPEGCAHGYQTLADGAEVLYLISAAYAPHAAGGARFDDPSFAIRWPLAVTAIHERDRTYPDFVPAPRMPPRR